ncbi:hypothetical protein NIES4101_29260 [Calothrix sp. NIES-4101]|nr:hypothetical protein NIES4101_29260 [Calothrix sp. NIES-4101]
MSHFTKTSRLSRFVNFAVCGIFLSSVAIKTEDFSASAQEIQSNTTSLLISQRFSTRELRAESGPDDKGRWRFYQPSDVSADEMRSQGCAFVGGGTPWRCSSRKIRVQVNNNNNNRPDYGYRNSTRELRAESGPDDKGRWRFYKPNDVSLDEMRSQGCAFVGGGTPWRCSSRKIRVQVNNNNNNNNRPDYGYGNSTRELRAESGPDDKGRWRFYKPNDVSWDSMQGQGCTHVGASSGHPAPWRCPRQKIRVQVDNRP